MKPEDSRPAEKAEWDLKTVERLQEIIGDGPWWTPKELSVLSTPPLLSTRRVGSWFQSHTGRQIHPFDLRLEDICLEDIAHHLSLINRFVGAMREPYSVAQHSLYVSDHLPPHLQVWGLLHDAPEALSGFGDVSRPAKKSCVVMLPTGGVVPLHEFEKQLMSVVAARFGLPKLGSLDEDSIARADDVILATEKRDVMGPSEHEWMPLPEPLERRIEPLDWRVVEAIFLARAKELGIR